MQLGVPALYGGLYNCACMHAVLSNSFVTPMDCSPPVSSVRGIIWAGILEWVAIS